VEEFVFFTRSYRVKAAGEDGNLGIWVMNSMAEVRGT
jgi:hypothetical protein